MTKFPIKRLASEQELDDAIAVIDGLLSRARPLDAMESGYLESPSHEIERCEAAIDPMPPVSGAAMLRRLIEAKDVTLSNVAAGAGIAVSTLSSVSTGKRQLNLNHIAKLAPYFGVEPGAFLE